MGYSVTTAPASEPVSLSEAKAHLKREDTTDDDTMISTLIEVARSAAEEYTGRAMLTQTVTETFYRFPVSTRFNDLAELRFSLCPVQSLTSVSYIDSDGSSQALTLDNFKLDAISEPVSLSPKINYSWPSTGAQAQAVTAVYVAGYTQASDVPAPIRQAILHMIGDLYENRENPARTLPTLSKLLLDPYRVNWF